MKLFFKFIFTIWLTACFTSCSPLSKTITTTPSPSPEDSLLRAQSLYAQHCAACHGEQRTGLTGPALIPETLTKLKIEDLSLVIKNGRTATQMPGFDDKISDVDRSALAHFLKTPIHLDIQWNSSNIIGSLKVFDNNLSSKPIFFSDPWNLFFVVAHGEHDLNILDGDRFEVLKNFKMRPGLHGGVKYTKNGRLAFTVTRDGWLSKFDVYGLKQMAEVRLGINTRNIALSEDGRYLMAGNLLPANFVILDVQTLKPLFVEELFSRDGKKSRASAVYNAPPRKSFVVALKDAPELWEVQIKKQKLKINRTNLSEPLDDFYFNSKYSHVLGAAREGKSAFVVDLNKKTLVKSLNLPGLPHLGSGILWKYKGKEVMATPNIKKNSVSIIDTTTWEILNEVNTLGPGFFMRSHEKTPFAWVDNFMSASKDSISLINKKTLALERNWTPVPGKTAAHVEFTKDGKYALVSLWDDDGALLVVDSATLAIVKRLPMKKPSGKYNIYNKTHLSEGTSH